MVRKLVLFGLVILAAFVPFVAMPVGTTVFAPLVVSTEAVAPVRRDNPQRLALLAVSPFRAPPSR